MASMVLYLPTPRSNVVFGKKKKKTFQPHPWLVLFRPGRGIASVGQSSVIKFGLQFGSRRCSCSFELRKRSGMTMALDDRCCLCCFVSEIDTF